MTDPATVGSIVDRLAVLDAAATPAPWDKWAGTGIIGGHIDWPIGGPETFSGDDGTDGPFVAVCPRKEDQAAIAAMRNALPALLDGARTLERIAEQQQKSLATIQANGFVFEDIGAEPGNWQHLAFTLYCDLCEIDTDARAALAALNQEGGAAE